ncbi:hypothetical protein ARC78_08695 [Stenotrophomonas pictorum JCM 9942]|jgi:hypothetical protein|uniref:Lipoprotein n=1 Tax=Stenotrophomonas pictorum JCM 9942 TaxID=1236960 RepID=A0A0R0ADK9_9GAMM|nr:DUF6491 family protein [Stenotrophomonas pictorum]KRG42757.1 hypothetical protein ARC78_08695 [Stenotrophomonas pictorum JCM 9942]
MRKLLVTLIALAALAGCATTGKLSSDERLALYRAHAGEPVKDFQYFGSLNGWTELGDSALAVWTRPSEAYLLELMGPCIDLDFAPAISVTNQMGRVSARFDSVIVLGAGLGGPGIPCRIQTIRPVDVKGLRQTEKALREARLQEREAAKP